jgi:hypothetical protein
VSDTSGRNGKPHVVLRSRRGKQYAVPVDELATFVGKYAVPEDTILLRWGPRQRALVPEAELERFVLSAEESLLFTAFKGGSRRRGRPTGRP